MKKLLLTICFALASVFSFAQLPALGIKAGANFATVANSNDGTEYSSGMLATFNAGFFADIQFGNTSLQPALNFTGKGGNGNGDFNGNLKLYYLQLPVNIVYHIPAVVGNLYFGVGPYIAKGLSGKITNLNVIYPDPSVGGNGPISPGGATTVTRDVKFGSAADEIKSTQIGADAIVGFQFKNGFLINANYDLGITNDSNEPMETSRSRVFGLSIGYCFL